MEPRYDYDFSHVKIHTDSKAAQSAQEINATAYTAGKPGQVMEDVTRGCASCGSCEVPEVRGEDTGDLKWGELTIAVDRVDKMLLKAIKSHNVGHTWTKLRDNLGNRYSYGFCSQSG